MVLLDEGDTHGHLRCSGVFGDGLDGSVRDEELSEIPKDS